MRQRYVQFLPLVVVVDVDVAVDDGEAIVDEVGGKNMPLTPLQIVAG